MIETEPQYVKVHTLSNRFEADVVTEALKQEGIPVLLRSFVETPYSGLFVPQRGWGRVMVPEQMADRAREIISRLAEANEPEDRPPAGARKLEPGLWDALRRADPMEIESRTLVEYERPENVYIIPFLNNAILCYPAAGEIEVLGNLAHLSGDFHLGMVVLHYLLYCRGNPLSNNWISEKDLPLGSVLSTEARTLATVTLRDIIDAGPELFDIAAKNIGGEKAGRGELSYRFSVLPRIPVLINFQTPDEEFESAPQIMFDETVTDHLGSLDLVWRLVNVFARILQDAAAFSSTGNG